LGLYIVSLILLRRTLCNYQGVNIETGSDLKFEQIVMTDFGGIANSAAVRTTSICIEWIS